MLALLVGILAGIALNTGPFAPLGAPLRVIVEQLCDAAISYSDIARGPLTEWGGTELADTVAGGLALAAPGLVCLALVGVAKSSKSVRTIVVFALTVMAFISAVRTGLGAGIVLFALAGLVAVLGTFAARLVSVVTATLATTAAFVIVPTVLDPVKLAEAADKFNVAMPNEGMRLLLAAVAVAPIIAAAGLAVGWNPEPAAAES